MNDRRKEIVLIITIASLLIVILAATIPFCWAPWGFGPDEQLTTDPAWDMMPAVMQTRDGTMWVVWTSDMIRPGRYDLFFERSSDGGLSWSDPTRISWHPSIDEMPAATQTRDKKIWLVWASGRTGNKEIFFKTSDDDGDTWSTLVQLTNNTVEDGAPSITQNVDGAICVAWHRNDTGNYDIFCKTSFDNGLTWSNETQVTTDPDWDLNPSVTHLENGTLWLVFASHRADDNFEIFYKTSPDNGLSWNPPSGANRLTTDTAQSDTNPSVVQDVSGTIWVVWSKDLDIYYKTSPFPSSDERLSQQGDNTNPSVVCTNDRRIWVVWESTRSDWDIYYKISDEIPYVHDIAVIDIVAWGALGQQVTWVPRSIPIYVNVTVENQGHFTETFNVTAYAERNVGDVFIDIETRQNISLAAGANTTITLTWNTTDAPYGTYYLSGEASVVPGEVDTYDNILIHGAKIGGISLPWQPSQTSILSLLGHLASVIFIIVALGAIGIAFFKALMSVRPCWPWRLLVNDTVINPKHR